MSAFLWKTNSLMCLPGNIHLGSRGRQSSHIWKYDCSLPYIIFLFSPLRLNHRSDEIDDRMSFYLFNVSPTCWHKCLCFYFYEDYSVLSENMHPKVAAVCMSMPCHSTCEHTKHGIWWLHLWEVQAAIAKKCSRLAWLTCWEQASTFSSPHFLKHTHDRFSGN